MKRIIVLSVSLGLIAAIAITTILMALIPVGKVPTQILKPDFKVYYSTVDTSTFPSGQITLYAKAGEDNRDQETIDKIWEEFNNASKQKAITALFNGTISDTVKYEKFASYKYQPIKENEADKAIIVFEYDKKQYVDDKGNKVKEDAEKKTTYNYVLFEISKEDVRSEVNIMIGEYSSLSQIKVYGQYTMSGNFAELYNVVTNAKTAA